MVRGVCRRRGGFGCLLDGGGERGRGSRGENGEGLA
jgi:hypothetical protein